MENPMFGLSGEYRMPEERYRYQKEKRAAQSTGEQGNSQEDKEVDSSRAAQLDNSKSPSQRCADQVLMRRA